MVKLFGKELRDIDTDIREKIKNYSMKRFVKCFFELLAENFSARQETGQEERM